MQSREEVMAALTAEVDGALRTLRDDIEGHGARAAASEYDAYRAIACLLSRAYQAGYSAGWRRGRAGSG